MGERRQARRRLHGGGGSPTVEAATPGSAAWSKLEGCSGARVEARDWLGVSRGAVEAGSGAPERAAAGAAGEGAGVGAVGAAGARGGLANSPPRALLPGPRRRCC